MNALLNAHDCDIPRGTIAFRLKRHVGRHSHQNRRLRVFCEEFEP